MTREKDCSTCKHFSVFYDDIVVDGRTAACYEEWECAKEDELTEDELNDAFDNKNGCRLYEYNTDMDDPCYWCCCDDTNEDCIYRDKTYGAAVILTNMME